MKVSKDSYHPVARMDALPRESFRRGTAYECADAGISEVLGLTRIGAVYIEVPPGKSACPFHVHHVEDEMFIVLQGTGEYRFGNATYPVHAGDVLGAPCGGRELAHKLTNTGQEKLKYLAISSKSDTEICEYPDSDKFLVRSRVAGEQPFRFVGSVRDEKGYWDGEEGA